jgi:hypothetical protein
MHSKNFDESTHVAIECRPTRTGVLFEHRWPKAKSFGRTTATTAETDEFSAAVHKPIANGDQTA